MPENKLQIIITGVLGLAVVFAGTAVYLEHQYSNVPLIMLATGSQIDSGKYEIECGKITRFEAEMVKGGSTLWMTPIKGCVLRLKEKAPKRNSFEMIEAK